MSEPLDPKPLDREALRQIVECVLEELIRQDGPAGAVLDDVAKRAAREATERLVPAIRHLIELLEADLNAKRDRAAANQDAIEALERVSTANWNLTLGKA